MNPKLICRSCGKGYRLGCVSGFNALYCSGRCMRIGVTRWMKRQARERAAAIRAAGR